MRLDLGGGTKNTVAPGHVNIDLTKDADIKWDLNKGLPLLWMDEGLLRYSPDKNHPDKKTDEPLNIEGVRCHQVIEHLHTIIPLMNDVYEILPAGVIFELSTPRAGTDPFWQDPTHIKGYVEESFEYFKENSRYTDAQEEYGITCRFKVLDIWIENGWNMQIRLTK